MENRKANIRITMTFIEDVDPSDNVIISNDQASERVKEYIEECFESAHGSVENLSVNVNFIED